MIHVLTMDKKNDWSAVIKRQETIEKIKGCQTILAQRCY